MNLNLSSLTMILWICSLGVELGNGVLGEQDLSHHRRHSHGSVRRSFHSSDVRDGGSGVKSSFGTYFDPNESSKNLTLLLGEMALLHCTVRNIGNKSVSWLRHRTHIPDLLALNNLTNSLDSRITAIHSHGSEEYVLRIKNVEIRDSGKYECQVGGSSPSDTIYKFIFLEVLEPITRIIGGNDIYVDRGSTLNVTCVVSAGSRPPKYIFWSHNDKILLFDGSETSKRPYLPRDAMGRFYSRLVIRHIKHSHAGTYKCEPASSPIKTVSVHVLNGTVLAVADGEGNQSSSRSGTGSTGEHSRVDPHSSSSNIAAPVQQSKDGQGGSNCSPPSFGPQFPLLLILCVSSLVVSRQEKEVQIRCLIS